MNWAKVTKGAEGVNSDKHNSQNDEVLVKGDILTDRVEETLETENMDGHMLRCLGPLFCHFVHFFLPSKV